MARAGPSRSQRAPQPTQQSQQRGGRRASRQEDDDEEDAQQPENEDGDDEDVDMDQAEVINKGDELTRKANDLVRLALFTEHKRTPLRRDDINKKVLGSSARSFNTVFEMAQKILRKTFGMELVELRSRAEIHTDGNANGSKDDDLEEARKATTGMKKKAAAAGSKTYILRSVLHPMIIEYAALTDVQILEEEAADGPDDDDDDEGLGEKHYGSIISWSNADQLGSIGILYVILTLILVSGRVITDMDLRANLKRLRLPPTALLTFNAQSTHKQMALDAYLALVSRQGYIERHRIGEAAAGGAGGGNKKGGKRGRASGGMSATQQGNGTAAAEDGTAFEWRWGNRAHSEVGEMAITGFAAEFMVERMGLEEEEGEEGGGRGGAARERRDKAKKNILEKMVKGFERSAGGNLSEIK